MGLSISDRAGQKDGWISDAAQIATLSPLPCIRGLPHNASPQSMYTPLCPISNAILELPRPFAGDSQALLQQGLVKKQAGMIENMGRTHNWYRMNCVVAGMIQAV